MDERASLPPPPPPPQPDSRRRCWVGLPLLPPSDCFVPPLGYSLAKAASLSSPLLSSLDEGAKNGEKEGEGEGGGGAAPTNNPLPLFSLPSFGMLVFSTGSVRPSSTSSSVIFCRVSLLGLVSVTCGKHVGKERLQFGLDRILIVFKSYATSPQTPPPDSAQSHRIQLPSPFSEPPSTNPPSVRHFPLFLPASVVSQQQLE